jgi:hypothetical protein
LIPLTTTRPRGRCCWSTSLRAGGVHDADAFEQVVKGLAADPRVRVADAAELVVVVLEDVGVDRAEADAVALGVFGGELEPDGTVAS